MEFSIDILTFILSFFLIILSAWSLSTFIRLNKAIDKWPSDVVSESSSQISKEYVKTNMISEIIILVFRVILMILSSWVLWNKINS